MQKNIIWVTFLLIVTGFSVWFVIKGGYDLIQYYQFNQQIPVSVDKWEVVELEANKYALSASYSYEFEGKNYTGKAELSRHYPNPWSAERALVKLKENEQAIWINPNNPHKGVLERKFPYKATLSAILLLGLVVYFICLGLYVSIKNEQRR